MKIMELMGHSLFLNFFSFSCSPFSIRNRFISLSPSLRLSHTRSLAFTIKSSGLILYKHNEEGKNIPSKDKAINRSTARLTNDFYTRFVFWVRLSAQNKHL